MTRRCRPETLDQSSVGEAERADDHLTWLSSEIGILGVLRDRLPQTLIESADVQGPDSLEDFEKVNSMSGLELIPLTHVFWRAT